MPIKLYRIDDRLIHGQVVAGWCQPLGMKRIVLVDDAVASTDWEQDLYKMGVPPDMEIIFDSIDSAVRNHESYVQDERDTLLLTGSINTMLQLVQRVSGITAVNLGGVHHKMGRIRKLRYIFLTPDEERALREMATLGVSISAQDVPTADPLTLEDALSGEHAA